MPENNDNLTPEQEASIHAIEDRVKKLDAEQMALLEARMAEDPENTDFESMLDEIEKSATDATPEPASEEGDDAAEEAAEDATDGDVADASDEAVSDESPEAGEDYAEAPKAGQGMPESPMQGVADLGATIACEPIPMPVPVEPATMPVSEEQPEEGSEAAAEPVGEPMGVDEKPEGEEIVTVEDVERMRKAQRRSRRSLRVACAIIGTSLAVIIASILVIVVVFSADHFAPPAAVAIEDAAFGISEDDLSMLAAEGYDGDELTEDVAQFMKAFFTFDKASVEDGSWQRSFEKLIASDDLVKIKENLLYARVLGDWSAVFEYHPYYKSKWISNNSISWNILPTDTVNVPYCDVYATIECSPLEVYFLNSPSLEINRYVNCYRIVFDADGKITSIKKLRTIQKRAAVDKDAMESDAKNAEKAFEAQRKKAEQLAKEKAAAEEAEKARKEAEEEAKKKAEEEEKKAQEEADKKKEEEPNRNENSNSGNSNENTGGNTNTGGDENTNTGGNENTGGNTGEPPTPPAPAVPDAPAS